MTRPLTDLHDLPATVTRPGYDRDRLKPGILHLGPGAFFRSHTAAFTDGALAAEAGDWGILAAGLRSPEVAATLNAQRGLYTLLVRDGDGTRAQVIGAVLGGVAPDGILDRMSAPEIRIVTLTITEKAYGLDPATGGLDAARPDIAADLATPGQPRSAVGLVAAALARRRMAGIAPFTPLSCDNLPGNGRVLRRLVLDFAARHDPGLADWIAATVPFPCTMVDRITPASTPATLQDAARLTGHDDQLAVQAEAFAQWVIEDDFATGRPAWDRAGALFVADVTPFEHMKLRMLNGTHSLMAYLGLAAGHEFVRDAIADPAIAAAAKAHLALAATTLDPVPGIDPADYARALIGRFQDRAIAHRLAQIAMDGTQKLPPRVFEPAQELLARGADAGSFALITAAWMHFTLGPHPLNDPREAGIRAALAGLPHDPATIAGALIDLPGLFPAALRDHADWRAQVVAHLDRMMQPH